MSAPDTDRSSAITDHPFEPRTRGVTVDAAPGVSPRFVFLPSSSYLCGFKGCNLAEAAHKETTVKR